MDLTAAPAAIDPARPATAVTKDPRPQFVAEPVGGTSGRAR
jgi:hypothetical protein